MKTLHKDLVGEWRAKYTPMYSTNTAILTRGILHPVPVKFKITEQRVRPSPGMGRIDTIGRVVVDEDKLMSETDLIIQAQGTVISSAYVADIDGNVLTVVEDEVHFVPDDTDRRDWESLLGVDMPWNYQVPEDQRYKMFLDAATVLGSHARVMSTPHGNIALMRINKNKN